MRWCQRCVLPDTRPNLVLDEEGVCNACRSHGRKREVDWQRRKADFVALVEEVKGRGPGHDCLIPVSGGKDSHWQVAKALEHGLNPLAVTWKTPTRTAIGQRNLDNLVSLGVDHIDYQINPRVERRFVYQALERLGDPAIPMHMALFAIPLRLAVHMGIPLVLWGENSAVEYGGPESLAGAQMDDAWLASFGVTHGTTARDWVGPELNEKELTPYFAPTQEQMRRAGCRAVFLGHYFPWDPEAALRVAREHGFSPDPEGPKVGYYDYADIDDGMLAVHHWLKWYKFGFTRTFDNLSLEIRNGRLSREEALEIIARRGDETPWAEIDRLCDFLDIGRDRFWEVIETFRNRDIWKQREGRWRLEDFLLPQWQWT